MTTRKALHNQTPKYIQQLVAKRQQQNNYVRSNKLLLKIPSSLGKNKFEDRAPKLWNNLSDNVRNARTLFSFKKDLKTHLFEMFYNT